MGFIQQYIYEVGQVFGKLTVIEYVPGKASWKCKCMCGNIIEAESSRLRNNGITNCGSIRCKLKRDIVGEQFGRLLVLNEFEYRKAPSGSRIVNRSYVKVQCDCGKEKFVLTTALLGGDTTSCGCYKKQRINETYGNYRISKGYSPTEYITPIIRLARATSVATGINKKILQRDKFKCKLCMCNNTVENPLQVHHIIPISHNLHNHGVETNLITLCTKCHIEKAHSGDSHKLNESLIPVLQQLTTII